MQIAFSTIQTPNCGHSLTFSLSATIPTFMRLQSLTASGGNIQILGATSIDQGNYYNTLFAEVDSIPISASFKVIIVDLCSTAIF